MFSQADFPQYDSRISLQKNNRLKRPRIQSSDCLWFQEPSVFIKLRCLKKDTGFSTYNPFRIRDSISSVLKMSSNSLNIDLLGNGEILFPIKNRNLANSLVLQSPLILPGIDLEVEVQLDVFANSSKGKVEAPCWDKIPKDELLEDLREQGVTDVYRIKRLKKGEYVNTNFYILSFNTTKCPSNINIGFYNAICKLHIPNPSVCKKCWKFNHSAKSCKSAPKCGKCGSTQHTAEGCNVKERCANCLLETHTATSRACPEFLKAKKVKVIMALEGVTRNTAQRKMIEQIRSGEFSPKDESKALLENFAQRSGTYSQVTQMTSNTNTNSRHEKSQETQVSQQTQHTQHTSNNNTQNKYVQKTNPEKSKEKNKQGKDKPHPYQGTDFDPNLPSNFNFQDSLGRSQSSCNLIIPDNMIITRSQSQNLLSDPKVINYDGNQVSGRVTRKTKSSTTIDTESIPKQNKKTNRTKKQNTEEQNEMDITITDVDTASQDDNTINKQ